MPLDGEKMRESGERRRKRIFQRGMNIVPHTHITRGMRCKPVAARERVRACALVERDECVTRIRWFFFYCCCCVCIYTYIRGRWRCACRAHGVRKGQRTELLNRELLSFKYSFVFARSCSLSSIYRYIHIYFEALMIVLPDKIHSAYV